MKSVHTVSILKKEKKHWQLYLMLLLPVSFILLFHYLPMYGLQLAFKDFSFSKGLSGSPWVGLKNFEDFYNSYQFVQIIRNTFVISICSIIIGFPIPIIFAIALNELKNKLFSKTVQTVAYAPFFISTVVIVGIIFQILDPNTGPINSILKSFDLQTINFMGESSLFVPIYIISNIWQFTGYTAIIYLAVLSGVDPELQEAAVLDGASKLQRIWNVDIPHIMPIAMTLLILSMGHILSVDFEKIYLMQTPLTLSVAEVISTYVYKVGLISAQYGLATAIGLFSGIVNLTLLFFVDRASKKITGTSLF